MHASPITFKPIPPDGFSIHLIQSSHEKNGLHTPPSEDLSEDHRIAGGQKITATCALFHKIFKKKFQDPKEALRWVLRYLPFFTIFICILKIVVSFTVGLKLRNKLQFNPGFKFEVHRYVTYMLVHSMPSHMVMNVALQLVLGTPTEIEQGPARTALVCLGGVVGGSLASAIFEPDTIVLGSSAGVYALLTAQIAQTVLNFSELRYKRRLMMLMFLLVADMSYSCFHVFYRGNTEPQISLPAHVFGALSGALLSFSVFNGSNPWTKMINYISSFLAIIYFLIFIIINTTLPNDEKD